MLARVQARGVDPLAGGRLGEPVAVVPVGEQDVGVVEQAVDGGGREGLGHQLVEAGRVDVRGERDRAFLVGGVDDAEERLGGVGRDREQADIIDDDQVGADQPPIAWVTVSSARWRRSSTASVSRVCQATVLP